MVEHALALSTKSFVLTRGLDRAQDYTWTEVSRESTLRCTEMPSYISKYGLEKIVSLGPPFVGVFISSDQLVLVVNKYVSPTRTDFIGRPITLSFAIFYPLASFGFVKCRFYAMEDSLLSNLDRQAIYTNERMDYEVNVADWWQAIDGTVTWPSTDMGETLIAFDSIGLILFRPIQESSARFFDPPLTLDGITSLLKIPSRFPDGEKERRTRWRRFL